MADRRAPTAATRLEEWFKVKVEVPAAELLAGSARLRVIVLLAATLALDSADKAMVGAIAVPLKQSMGIGNVQLAMLITAPTLISALATLPAGAYADRVNRAKLLAVSIAGWAVIMFIGGIAVSYFMLFLSRLSLGATVAIATPVVASLTGDYFQPRERARIWGYILAGEVAGIAVGYIIAGNIAALLSWRVSLWTLGVLSAVLAPLIWYWLPEPARGDYNQMPSVTESQSQDEARRDASTATRARACNATDSDAVEQDVTQRGVQAHETQVLQQDPARLQYRQAVRYILSIRTNVVLIVASALGYFFFGTLLTFGVVFMRNRFGLGQIVATTLSAGLGAGAIIGVLGSGRFADWLIARGRLHARIIVAALAFLCATALFLPALLVPSLWVAAPLLFLGAIALGGTNPPLDAARLDIMHFRLWGRAEGVRAALRYVAQAIAPLLFALVYMLFTGNGSLFGVATGHVQNTGALAYAFSIMVIPLLAAGCVLFSALRSYASDVATARASEQAGEHDRDDAG